MLSRTYLALALAVTGVTVTASVRASSLLDNLHLHVHALETKPAPAIDPERTVIVSGVISGGNVTQLTPNLMRMAAQDVKKPIDIIISSPGGELVTGGLFVNVMEGLRGKGVTLRCYVPTVAASMAFQLLLHCDERYSLENSVFLWHGARVFLGDTPVTQEMAMQLSLDLEDTNSRILSDLEGTLGKFISADELERHFHLETLHTGAQLAERAPGFVHVYKYIPGLVEAMVDPRMPRSPERAMKVAPGSIFHAAMPDQLGAETPGTGKKEGGTK